MKIETLHIRKHAGPADASGHPYIAVKYPLRSVRYRRSQ